MGPPANGFADTMAGITTVQHVPPVSRTLQPGLIDFSAGSLTHGNIFGSRLKMEARTLQSILRAMQAIEVCRTPLLGGHVDQCDHCDHLEISYNSCRSRHCPKCQFLRKKQWIKARRKDLLPIQYFHVVFTIPYQRPLDFVPKRGLPPRKGYVQVVQEQVSGSITFPEK